MLENSFEDGFMKTAFNPTKYLKLITESFPKRLKSIRSGKGGYQETLDQYKRIENSMERTLMNPNTKLTGKMTEKGHRNKKIPLGQQLASFDALKKAIATRKTKLKKEMDRVERGWGI